MPDSGYVLLWEIKEGGVIEKKKRKWKLLRKRGSVSYRAERRLSEEAGTSAEAWRTRGRKPTLGGSQQVESSWGRKHKSTWWGNRQKVSESGRQWEKTQTERKAQAGQARALGIWRFSHTRQLELHNLRGLLQNENLELLVKKKNRGNAV